MVDIEQKNGHEDDEEYIACVGQIIGSEISTRRIAL